MRKPTKAQKIQYVLESKEGITANEVADLVEADLSYVYEVASRLNHKFRESPAGKFDDDLWERDLVRTARELVAGAMISFTLGEIDGEGVRDVVLDAEETVERYPELSEREGLATVLEDARVTFQ